MVTGVASDFFSSFGEPSLAFSALARSSLALDADAITPWILLTPPLGLMAGPLPLVVVGEACDFFCIVGDFFDSVGLFFELDEATFVLILLGVTFTDFASFAVPGFDGDAG